MSYLKNTPGSRVTPQSEPMRDDQVENSAGGYAWAVGPFARLLRWLILGSEGGAYYAGEQKLTAENIEALKACIAEDGVKTVRLITEVSEAGRAPKNDQAIFALAVCSGIGDEQTRIYANRMIPRVCRTATHLFQFVGFVEKFRGWGPSLCKGVSRWYEDKDADALAYQVVKYRNRDGMTHRDVLRLAHPAARSAEHRALFAFISGHESRGGESGELPRIVEGFKRAQESKSAGETAQLIREYGLPREALVSEHLADPVVWDAMLEKGMPLTALIRNLANMTRAGVLAPGSAGTLLVIETLGNAEAIRKARVHPLNVLIGMRTYAAGHGFRSDNTWNPVVQIVDALDGAFYKAFGNVELTGKRFLLGLDVSGSMSYPIANTMLSCREASAAMALVTAAVEPGYEAVAFTSGGWSGHPSPGYRRGGVESFPLSPRQRLDDVVHAMNELPFGATDCALPMLYALQNGREVDAFVIYTDSGTWHGQIHPVQALQKYRERSGIDAKLVVVGMVSNGFSIADPLDRGMLDVVGFDTATPNLIGEFAAGRI